MTKRKIAVLMTACIAPEPGISGKPGNRLKRADPVLRFNDYASALAFWLDHPDPRIGSIVFADNSGYDLSNLNSLVQGAKSKRYVELLRVPPCTWPEHVHYGFCELQIIDEALSRSALLREEEYFLKATGRLQFRGLTRLLNRLSDEFLFAVDCHRRPFSPEIGAVATQLMLFNKQFYVSNLVGVNRKLQPWVTSHVEDLLFRELMKFHGAKGAVLRWPVNVEYVGVSATTNESYSSAGKRLKRTLRAVARIILPWLWL
jgi:hypothetical protein